MKSTPSLARALSRLAVIALMLTAQQSPCASRMLATSGSPAGERLYREGLLTDGTAVLAQRSNGSELSGQEAACANCHRRSGMGGVEGGFVIAPITADALFHAGEAEVNPAGGAVSASTPAGSREHAQHLATPPHREAYSNETLARAIREGVGADGRKLSGLMPRYRLDEPAMRALLEHLHQLGTQRTPGAINDELHFATVVTPDADPAARDAMLDVLRAFFAQKNDFQRTPARSASAGGTAPAFRIERRWVLHVWTLAGAADTWGAQLDADLRREPVFALVSGIGRSNWVPVHQFCEHHALPCLLPNLDLPVVDPEHGVYSVYFSRGVLLEADLIAGALLASNPKAGRVVQVFRSDDAGEAAAAALRRDLASAGLEVLDRALAADATDAALAGALAEAGSMDALVLWLRAGDLEHLPATPASSSASNAPMVFLSGLLGGFESAPFPEAWRQRVRMPYVLALPDERRVVLDYPLGWLRAQHLTLVDVRVQVDTYIACALLADNLISTHGRFLRDFLIERLEDATGTLPLSGNYRRLELAPGRRFASKGGYLVHFVGNGRSVVPDGEYRVP